MSRCRWPVEHSAIDVRSTYDFQEISFTRSIVGSPISGDQDFAHCRGLGTMFAVKAGEAVRIANGPSDRYSAFVLIRSADRNPARGEIVDVGPDGTRVWR